MTFAANPALADLAVLVGDWELVLSDAAFLPDPTATVQGRASFTWIEDGAYLLYRIGDRTAGPPWSLSLIGRDEQQATYTVLYVDDRGVSRSYAMRFDAGEWQQWRAAPGFSQRFRGTVSEDHNTITARWETSADGVQWEHDFAMTFRRVV
jgi:hypothetical protein